MQIEGTIGVLFPSSVESPPVENVIVLADNVGVALGAQRALRVRSARDDGRRPIASRCVEIPRVGSEGEVLGILCHTGPRCDTCGAVALRERQE